MEELKPCIKGHYTRQLNHCSGVGFYIFCPTCSKPGEVIPAHKTEKQAIAAWNKRA